MRRESVGRRRGDAGRGRRSPAAGGRPRGVGEREGDRGHRGSALARASLRSVHVSAQGRGYDGDMSDSSVPGSLRVGGEHPDRNLALELVRVTEAAAMAAGRWVGRGDKNGADGAAVNAMRQLVSTVSMKGVVVIGEGEKDEAPMLYNGEEVGDGDGPDCDVAVDPIDGTTLTAKGMNKAVSGMGVSERGSMYDASVCFYMQKLVVGPEAADVVDINSPV